MALQSARQTRPGCPATGLASWLAVAAILAGCTATKPPTTPPLNVQTPSAPAPSSPVPPNLQPPAGSGFFFNRDGDTASLAYGEPNSDAVTLFFSCKRGARRVQITDAAHSPKPGQSLTLISEAARTDLPIRITPDEERGGPVAVAIAPTDAPALTAFRKSGKIAFGLSGPSVSLTATSGEMISIAKFFAVCEQSPHRHPRGRR